jgi:hypothetical protein
MLYETNRACGSDKFLCQVLMLQHRIVKRELASIYYIQEHAGRDYGGIDAWWSILDRSWSGRFAGRRKDGQRAESVEWTCFVTSITCGRRGRRCNGQLL